MYIRERNIYHFAVGIHLADQALHLFGIPKSITALIRTTRDEESDIEDWCTMILQYGYTAPNLVVTLKCSCVSPMTNQLRYLIRGNKGSYLKVGLLCIAL